jgi:steroid delta-isomerase-like uncharacterized protein
VTAARNKRLARRFYDEFWTKGNAAAADELVAEDLEHAQFPPGWPTGREGFKRLVDLWREGFPDMREEIELMVAEADWVVSRFVLRGTHRGSFYGLEPTDREVVIRGVDMLRFAEGRIVEWIYYEDILSAFKQLGALPSDVGAVAGAHDLT